MKQQTQQPQAPKSAAADWEEFSTTLLENAHDALLEDLEDSVEHQAKRLFELGNASEQEIRAAVRRGWPRLANPVCAAEPRDQEEDECNRNAQPVVSLPRMRGW